MQHHVSSRARLGAAVLALGAIGAIACSDDATGVGGTGTVLVRLTDAPIDSVREVNVFVTRIEAKAAEGDSADAATATTADSAAQRGWVAVATPNRLYNLLALRTDTARLAPTSLPAGNWRALRLVINPSQSYVILKDGTRLDGGANGTGGQPGVTFPSGSSSGLKVQLDRAIAVVAGDTTTVTIDFDAAQSFHQRGTAMRNGLTFRPVIRAMVK